MNFFYIFRQSKNYLNKIFHNRQLANVCLEEFHQSKQIKFHHQKLFLKMKKIMKQKNFFHQTQFYVKLEI